MIIKRVIAVEGQTVDIDLDAGKVYVDGEELDEPYIKAPTHVSGEEVEYPLTVPQGEVFVMGDNRPVSYDSRYMGTIDTRYILGKAILRVYPFSKFGGLYD